MAGMYTLHVSVIASSVCAGSCHGEAQEETTERRGRRDRNGSTRCDAMNQRGRVHAGRLAAP